MSTAPRARSGASHAGYLATPLRLLESSPSEEIGFPELVAKVVGPKKTVLILDADPAVEIALRQVGCELHTVDRPAGSPRLQGETRSPATPNTKQYDAVLLRETLTRSVDPVAILTELRPQLRDGGYIVALVDNASSIEHRLQALTPATSPRSKPGSFQPLERKLDRAAALAILAQAGFGVAQVRRVERSPEPDRVPERLDPALQDLVARWGEDPDAVAQQFVFLAYPVPWNGQDWLRQVLEEASDERARLETDIERLQCERTALQNHVQVLLQQHAAWLNREKELRQSLGEYRDHAASLHRVCQRLTAQLADSHTPTLRAWFRSTTTGRLLAGMKRRVLGLVGRLRNPPVGQGS